MNVILAFLSKVLDTVLLAVFNAWVLVEKGRAEQQAEDLRGRLNDVQKANDLREEAVGRMERDPASILSDDGFERKE